MKHIICIVVIVSGFLKAGFASEVNRAEVLAFAKEYEREAAARQQPRNRPAGSTEIKAAEYPPPRLWEIASEIYYFSYREPDVMRENGMMYGLAGSYAYHDNYMLKVEGRGSIGRVNYKNSGTINNIRDYSFEFRGLGGYDFQMPRGLVLTPYFGIGYRYLNDDSSGKISSTGAAGYERESNYIYSPVGIEGNMRLKDAWTVGVTAEYDIFWWGRQISHLSDVNPGYSDPKNTQTRGYGFRGSVKLQRNGDRLDLMIEPFVRYWNIAKSNDSGVTYLGTIVGYGYEPENNTTECGVKLGAKF